MTDSRKLQSPNAFMLFHLQRDNAGAPPAKTKPVARAAKPARPMSARARTERILATRWSSAYSKAGPSPRS